MTGSSLVTSYVPAYRGNYTNGRQGHKIKKITIHHMAGRLTCEQCGTIFQRVGRQGSSHYGIGYDGRIAQYVDETDTAWTDGNWDSNLESVTIENSDIKSGAPWDVTAETLTALIQLCADIAKRNGLGLLVKGKNLTWHSMYQATACPGEGLLRKMDYICDEANKIIAGVQEVPSAPAQTSSVSYAVCANGRWLPTVTGHDKNDANNGYAGILGQDITGVMIQAPEGVKYKVHLYGGGWLPEVTGFNKNDANNGYAGILGKPIDAIAIQGAGRNLRYCVHTPNIGWLPDVTGYNEKDANNGYAGIFGRVIDALIVY